MPAATRLDMLVGKGQSLLSLDQAGEALAAFEEALALEPDHTDALVKQKSLGIPDEILWEGLGYSPQQIARIKRLIAAAPPAPLVPPVADPSMATPGLASIAAPPAPVDPGSAISTPAGR